MRTSGQPGEAGVRAVFRDPDECIEAIKSWGQGERRMTALGPFWRSFVNRDLGCVSLFAVDLSPTIFEIGGQGAGTTSFIVLDEHSAPIYRNGVKTTPRDLFVYPSDADICSRNDRPATLLHIAIPDTEIGRYFNEPFSQQRITPSAESLRRLLGICRVGSSGRRVTNAVIECLASVENAVQVNGKNPALAVLRFQALLANRRAWPLALDDICRQLDIHERTLRRYCANCLDMGPHEYVTVTRLNKARQALARANPATAKVSAIARRYGFSDFRRFASDYRRLFGELPSATLRSVLSDSALLSVT